MKISDFSPALLRQRLRDPGIDIWAGPFLFGLRTDIEAVVDGLSTLYGDFPLATNAKFADFHIEFKLGRKLLRPFRLQAGVYVDGVAPAAPLPVEQAFALFEGTLNWCIYTYAHQHFIIHAAAIERNGFAAVLPAPPGSGKSTLCAALVHKGWRLLTDELTVIDLASDKILAMPRPISLKNESCKVIAELVPGAIFGPSSPNTIKGTITHLRPPDESVRRMQEPSPPAWVVFPKYRGGTQMEVQAVSKANTFMQVAESAVNYSILGSDGFRVLSRMIDCVDGYELQYGDLEMAVAWFETLAPKQSANPVDRV